MRADLLFLNGPVLTLDGPDAEALATSGDRILAVGRREEVEALAGPGTRTIDLGGRPLLAGFIDAHTHLVQYGVSLLRLDLSRARSVEEVLSDVRARAERTPDDGWVVGHSWDESKWATPRMPTREDLDRAAGRHPTVLFRVDMHMGVAGTEALRRAGFDPERYPDGAVREEDFYRLVDLVEPELETCVAGLRHAVHKAWERGVTSCHVIADAQDLRALQLARDRGHLGVRCSLFLREETFPAAEALGARRGLGDEWIRVLGLKLFADGSLGSRTAAVHGEYEDDPGNRGRLLHDDKGLVDLVARCRAAGMQVAIHCIGDAAIAQALDALEAAGARPGERHRLEHLELFTDAQAERMARLGVVASAQPNFIGEWGHPGQMYEARLGPAVVGRHNRLRALQRAGVALAFGSDHMPFGPLYGVHCAVNAPTPEQRLTVGEALAAYTRGSSFAGFSEDRVGRLAPGQLADLVVLSGDPREAPDRVRDVRVDLTVVGGRVVFER